MSQINTTNMPGGQIPANPSGLNMRQDVNDALLALYTQHSGTSRPTYVQPGMTWLDITSTTPALLKFYDGSQDILIGSFNFTTHQFSLDGAGETLSPLLLMGA